MVFEVFLIYKVTALRKSAEGIRSLRGKARIYKVLSVMNKEDDYMGDRKKT